MAQKVKNMMDHIQILYLNNDPILKSVNDIGLLYDALYDLNEIVGMTEIKDSIIKLIKFLLVTHNDNKNSKFDDHMLHTMILGPPGVGKTSIGSVLSKIWSALGLLKKVKVEKSDVKQIYDDKKGCIISQKTDKGIMVIPVPIYLHDKNIDYSYDSPVEQKNKTKIMCNKETQTIEPSCITRSVLDNNDDLLSSSKWISNEDNKNPVIIEQKEKLHNFENDKLNDKINNDINPNFLINPIVYSHKCQQFDGSTFAYTIQRANVMTDMISFRSKMRNSALVMNTLNGYSKKFKPLGKFKTPLARLQKSAPIKVVSRPDFVGLYIGHTADKTQKLLINTLEEGKVLFIDEAYSLVLDEKDSFGNEALNELNRFMSEHPELIIIMAGYKEKMENTLFKHQPGFKRRCTWVFEIANYQPEMLSTIFKQQLAKDGWSFSGKTEKLTKFFGDKMNKFQAFGGDTLRLVLYCKLAYSEMIFDNTNNDLQLKSIDNNILKKAYHEIYLKASDTLNEDESYKHMYV